MHNRTIAVIGLGYVGLPVAVAFSKIGQTIGFDILQSRIEALQKGVDETNEVSKKDLDNETLLLTSDVADLKSADFFIIAVPTPIDDAKKPDLSILADASKLVSGVLKKKDIVVFESTVYPGATEEFCVPLLELYSGLKVGVDFSLGYSPERINPGDKEHTFTKIKKIVSAQNEETLEIVSEVYASVVEAGVYKASSIKVAEAAKVIENAQRDINIAFVNELSLIFEKIGISTHEVLEAANTKWNFLPFKPGLVGGHCIGVDPYYLTYVSESVGYYPEVILSGRRINDKMGKYIAEKTVKLMISKGVALERSSVAILGVTFKENCPDVRNTKVVDIVTELKSYNINSLIYDPLADKNEVLKKYNIELSQLKSMLHLKVVIIAVAHNQFHSQEMTDFLNNADVIIDVKDFFKGSTSAKRGII